MAPEPPQNVEKSEKKLKENDGPIIVELSDEDKQIKEEIDLLIERLNEPDQKLYRNALELLRTMIRTSTTSMTSVPKPLKFLRPYFKNLKEIHDKIIDKSTKEFCADIVSVLSMTFASENQECLKYRLMGSNEEIGSWGHEYVRHLSAEVRLVWPIVTETLTSPNAKNSGSEPETKTVDNTLVVSPTLTHLVQCNREKIHSLIRDIVKFSMAHNSETEACDLLMDIESLSLIKQHVDAENYQRVALYLVSCINYVPEPDNMNLLRTALEIYQQFQKPVEAMILALQMNDPHLVKSIFDACTDSAMKKQLAYILARQSINYLSADDTVMAMDINEAQHSKEPAVAMGMIGEEINEILSNTQLNTQFLSLARELDILEPKVPEDVYKSHLDPIRPSFGLGASGAQVDSARQNLASSFVNGFLNAGFGRDKLLTIDGGNKWIYKNKDHAMMSATASLGLIYLWDVDTGFTQIDKYLYTTEEYIKAGALMACGIVNTGVHNDCDPALALLADYVSSDSTILRLASFIGLGLAYAGSKREDVLSLLLEGLRDPKASMETLGICALSCGLIAIGSECTDLTNAVLSIFLEKSDIELRANLTPCRFLALSLALTNMGKQEAVEVVCHSLDAVTEPIRSMSKTLIEACAYAGTGNVLKVQEFLHICSEHYEPDTIKKSETTSKDAKKKDGISVTTDKLAKNLSNLLKKSNTSTSTTKSTADEQKQTEGKSTENTKMEQDDITKEEKDKPKITPVTTPEKTIRQSDKKEESSAGERDPDSGAVFELDHGLNDKTFVVSQGSEAGILTADGGTSAFQTEQDRLEKELEKLVRKKEELKKKEKESDKPSTSSTTADETSTKTTTALVSTEEQSHTSSTYEDLSAQQGLAVIGIALIAMGEEIGCAMSYRTFGHLLRYGEPVIRRAVPLALALTSISNPSNLNIVDTLGKFSHDSDSEVAYNSIFALGIVGAGTNNARIAAMLRNLAQFYVKDPSGGNSGNNHSFVVRLAQALVHAGKGTLTLNPFHCDRLLARPVSLAGILIVLIAMLDAKNTILGKGHYLMYYLTAALRPRFLITFDPNLNPLSISVRVGQAVDVVGQAGKPKTITGFQTYTTPVLLGYGERAELATEEYVSLTPYLEGFVVLKKNPNYMEN